MGTNRSDNSNAFTNPSMNVGRKGTKLRNISPILQRLLNSESKKITYITRPTHKVSSTSHSSNNENKISKRYSNQGRFSPLTIIPLIGLVILNTIVFLVLSGYIIYAEISLTSYAPDPSKVIGLPSPIIAPKVQSSNMTSSMVDSMETVVTSNTNENMDVIQNVCNNNGAIIMSNLPSNVCVNAGRAFVKHFIPSKIWQTLVYVLSYKHSSSYTETEIETPRSI